LATNPETSVIGDIGLFDNDSDAEEEHVLSMEEILPEDEISEDVEEAMVSRSRVNRRYCLEGCDCERSRGRKCLCERRDDGLCSDQCQCNPQLCRTTPKEPVEEEAEEEEGDIEEAEEDKEDEEEEESE
jgi:hypothetical protein